VSGATRQSSEATEASHESEPEKLEAHGFSEHQIHKMTHKTLKIVAQQKGIINADIFDKSELMESLRSIIGWEKQSVSELKEVMKAHGAIPREPVNDQKVALKFLVAAVFGRSSADCSANATTFGAPLNDVKSRGQI